jgi:nitrogen fixation protein FixH
MSSTVVRRQVRRELGKDRWIPWVFAGALGFVVCVNMGLVYAALHSAPGLVSDKPYEEGVDYDAALARAATQDALGWRAAVSLEVAPGAVGEARGGKLMLDLSDRAGTPLAGATVEARLVRPVGSREVKRLALFEQGFGHYVAPLETRVGRWDLHLVAQRAGDRFVVTQRITVE